MIIPKAYKQSHINFSYFLQFPFTHVFVFQSYRSDYYSLGATFYELLTGELPYCANNLPGWIHCHISKLPTEPNQTNPDIPSTISNLVIKLMSKDAEDRYQSAYGLSLDLKQSQKQLKENRPIEDFSLGQNDVSGKSQIPQKLYGRDKETATLMSTFGLFATGKSEVIMVSGYSGVGKSALVHEIYKPIVREKEVFIEGKIDQLHSDIQLY